MKENQSQDSIEAVIAYPKTFQQKKQSFEALSMQREGLQARELYRASYDVPLLLGVALSFLLLFFVYLIRRQSLIAILLLMVKKSKTRLSPLLYFLLSLSGFFSVVTLFYFLVKKYVSFLIDWQLWGLLAICLLAYFSICSFLIVCTSYTIDKKALATAHYSITLRLFVIMGLLVFPLLLLALWGNQLVYSGLFYALLGVLVIRKILQLYFVSRILGQAKFSIFHSFLYLCTLEILPLVYIIMIVRFLIENN